MAYQYYEFQAVDRPLTEAEREYIQGLSSRARPTATRAVFTYSYSDFHSKPLSILEKCFDAMLYMANWGSYQLAFRLPKSAVNLSALTPYCVDDIIEVSTTSNSVILNIELHEEGGYSWIEENNDWLSTLLPLRQAILQGDYRVLYLAWLRAATFSYALDSDTPEPPVPPNLYHLNTALQSFVNWLEIDPDLIAVAAQTSATEKEKTEPFKEWITALSDQEKTALLLDIVTGDSAIATQLQAQLRQKFTQSSDRASETLEGERRSFATLNSLAANHQAEREAKEKAAAHAKRRQYLEELKPQQAQLWDTVKDLIAQKQARPYDQAIQHLIDLRDLAELDGTLAIFQARIRKMKAEHSSRSALIRRINTANLL